MKTANEARAVALANGAQSAVYTQIRQAIEEGALAGKLNCSVKDMWYSLKAHELEELKEDGFVVQRVGQYLNISW